MNISRTTKLVFFLSLLVIIVATGFVYIRAETMRLVNETIWQEQEVKQEVEKSEKLSFMKEDILRSAEYERKLSQYVSTGEITDLLNMLDDLIASSSVTANISDISYEKATDVAPLNAEFVSIKLSAVGTWRNIMSFLILLENTPYAVRVEHVQFNKYTDYLVSGRVVPQWSGEFTVRVLHLKN